MAIINGLQAQTSPLFSAASIEQHFVPVPYQVALQVGKTEISQASYSLFLESLEDPEQVAAYEQKETHWRDYLPPALQELEEEVLFGKDHPDYFTSPVQNISYEAAKAYCAWLTKHYNNLDNNQKYYPKVVFRLPTEQEWELAASSLSVYDKSYQELGKGTSNYQYPWLASSYKNKEGCALANFNLELESHATDKKCRKAFFPVQVEAYGANILGLYNVVGNVAEMVQEKGIAKGGSWYHSPAAAVIPAQQEYSQPEPYVGFRIFMEVLETPNLMKFPKVKKGPPGVLSLTDYLYMDQGEVTNIDWLEYQYWMRTYQPEHYDTTIVDSTVWWWIDSTDLITTDTGQIYDPVALGRIDLAMDYHHHPIYYDYPVVGISHAQAKAYCAWRTARVNEVLALEPKKQHKFGYVLYRLPTEKEWQYAAQGGLDKRDFPHGYVELLDRKGRKVFNVKWSDEKPANGVGISPLAPALAYMSNGYNYYNMIGNAAEMVAEQGIAKGGSWKHPKEESQIYQQIHYEQPTAWLGFRCICEIQHTQQH